MECFYKSRRPSDRGYRQRMHGMWKELVGKETTKDVSEQRLADQARTILKNNWFSAVEMEEIQRCLEVNDEEEEVEGMEVGVGETDEEMLEDRRTEVMRMETDNVTDNVDLEPEDAEEYEIVKKLKELMEETRNRERLLALRKVRRKDLMEETRKVDAAAGTITTGNISDTNRLMYACARLVTERMNIKVKAVFEERSEPPWKRRIKQNIKNLRQELAKLIAYQDGELKNRLERKRIEETSKKLRKRVETTIEETKQRLLAYANRLERYEARCKQFKQNQLFKTNQRQLYEELVGKATTDQQVLPNSKESKKFWSELWDKPVMHNDKTGWLEDLRAKDVEQQQEFEITPEKIAQQLKGMPNWKAPGPDEVHGFWMKNLKSLHRRLADQLQECMRSGKIPAWMTEGRTVLIVKDESKGSLVSNFRPIACLPVMYKLLTGMMAEAVYKHLERTKELPVEQKGCRKKTRGTKDQLLIDRMLLQNCKKRKTNLKMAWIDYKKAYDMVPHSWILESLRLVGTAKNILKLMERSMKNWKTTLRAGNKTLGQVNIKRGIFQGDSLSPLLFVIAMIPLTKILRKHSAGYNMEKRGRGRQKKINHLLFMDDLKLFGKSEQEIESLVQTVRVFSEDIKMEFGIDKCAVVGLNRGKLEQVEGVKLPSGKVIRGLNNEEGYKYLGILEADEMKHEETRNKVKKEYYNRVRKVLRSKLNAGNTVSALNTWAVSLVRYSAGIIKWRKEDLQVMDRKTRKLMTIHGALHPKSDVDRIYIPRKEGGRGLLSVQDCVEAEEMSLSKYIEESSEEWLKLVEKEGVLPKWDKETTGKVLKQKKKTERKVNWKTKEMHGQFVRQTGEVASKEMWTWLERGEMKKETEALIVAAQDQALSTNAVKVKIYKQEGTTACRMCKNKDETVGHLLSECSKLAQTEYKNRHDKVANVVHWSLCKKYGLQCAEKWYEHQGKKMPVLENEEVKILWDINIQTDHVIEHRRPDIVVLEKKEKKAVLIDIAVPGDGRIERKEEEKMERYEELGRELKKLWKLTSQVKVVPIVVGALGTTPKKLEKSLEMIGVQLSVGLLQKVALLGTARILRKVMEKEVE